MTVKAVALASADDIDLRRAYTGLLVPNGVRSARGGVVPGSGSGLGLSKVSGMTVRVAPGQVWVSGTSEDGQGAYLLDVSDAEDRTLADGDATRDRIDLIVARVRDDQHDGSGQTTAGIEVVQGAYPSVGQQPAAPAVPDSTEPLWEVRVNAGTSSGGGGVDTANFVSRRVNTVALGGVLPVASQAARDALSGVYPGMWVDRADTKALERWNGSAWEIGAQVPPAWQNINLEAKYQTRAFSGSTPRYRRVGDELMIGGEIEKSGSDGQPNFVALQNGQTITATPLPSNCRPSATRNVPGSCSLSSGSVSIRVTIQTNGHIALWGASDNNTSWVSLDGVRVPL